MKRRKGSMLAFPADEKNDFEITADMCKFLGTSKTEVLVSKTFCLLPNKMISNIQMLTFLYRVKEI